jgi:hypothetical protein
MFDKIVTKDKNLYAQRDSEIILNTQVKVTPVNSWRLKAYLFDLVLSLIIATGEGCLL